MRIRNNEYAIPSRVSRSAANLIQKLLSERPEDRPALDTLFNDSFFTKGFFPRSLPTMCCMTPPKFSSNTHSRYSRTKKHDSYKPSDTRDSALSKSPCGSDDGVRQLKSAFSSMNFQEGSKLSKDIRKKEHVESGVESQDSNGHDISNSLGKIIVYTLSFYSKFEIKQSRKCSPMVIKTYLREHQSPLISRAPQREKEVRERGCD